MTFYYARTTLLTENDNYAIHVLLLGHNKKIKLDCYKLTVA